MFGLQGLLYLEILKLSLSAWWHAVTEKKFSEKVIQLLE